MKKVIAVSLCLITIVICGWLILKNIDHLDIASNKSDTYAMWEKRKIDERTDIDFCDKQLLKVKIDQSRQNDKIESGIAVQTQFAAFIVLIIQVILLILLLLISGKRNIKK